METNPSQPIIFCNVDGVLTSARTYLAQSKDGHEGVLDAVAMQLLAALCSSTGATLIIASMWSSIYKAPSEWESLFARFGVKIKVEDVIPPSELGPGSNGRGVITRIQAHGDAPHVILDDDSWKDVPAVRAILVDRRVGLSAKDIARAAEMLAPDCELARAARTLAGEFGLNF